eukprot:3609518-Rhodomonas_salina.1
MSVPTENEAELEHVRGYLPMWVGPPTEYARLQISKSGRLLAYLDFDKRSFISLGRSPDKVSRRSPALKYPTSQPVRIALSRPETRARAHSRPIPRRLESMRMRFRVQSGFWHTAMAEKMQSSRAV